MDKRRNRAQDWRKESWVGIQEWEDKRNAVVLGKAAVEMMNPGCWERLGGNQAGELESRRLNIKPWVQRKATY